MSVRAPDLAEPYKQITRSGFELLEAAIEGWMGAEAGSRWFLIGCLSELTTMKETIEEIEGKRSARDNA